MGLSWWEQQTRTCTVPEFLFEQVLVGKSSGFIPCTWKTWYENDGLSKQRRVVCNPENHPRTERKLTHSHTLTEPPSVADESNDLAVTGGAYLRSVVFMSEGMQPLIKPSTSLSSDSLGASSTERARPCTRTSTLTWRTNACNNVCARAEAQLLGSPQLFPTNSHHDNVCIWWQFEWTNTKLKVQHYHVSVSKYLCPWRQFVLVTSRKKSQSCSAARFVSKKFSFLGPSRSCPGSLCLEVESKRFWCVSHSVCSWPLHIFWARQVLTPASHNLNICLIIPSAYIHE